MAKHDYHQAFERQIAAARPGSTLLLHSCCGPCSAAVLERLGEHFAVTLYFYNPNIHPEAEYQKRLEAQKTVLERMTPRYPAKLLAAPYDPQPFAAVTAGLEREPEGGARCTRCFFLRLEETAKLAHAQGFDYFTTTLTVSPHKDPERLNETGSRLGEEYHVAYLPADFKKKGGYQRSVELAKAWGLYRQNYCGCLYNSTITVP